jgi:oxygen-independent coproporphyrinogen-3 oxidase
VSLGVQSFVDREAHATGRLHDSRHRSRLDLRRLRAAGIGNLNVDLIAGLPNQTFASWEQSLDALLHADLPHASIYMLEVDEDSRLGREMLNGGSRYRAGLVPNDDAIARMYERAIERLDAAGLKQYEISNFSRWGFESRHNLRYWRRLPYIGFGLDASSMLMTIDQREPSRRNAEPRSVLRATTTDDLPGYLHGDRQAEITVHAAQEQHEEAWFLGLRTNAGVDVAALAREFGREIDSAGD